MRQLHSLQWSVFSTVSWILCFHLGKSESHLTSDQDRNIGVIEHDPDTAQVNSNHLTKRVYKDNHDSIISSQGGGKYDTSKVPLFSKTFLQQNKDLRVIGKGDSLKTASSISIMSSSNIPLTYHRQHGSGQTYISINNKIQLDTSPYAHCDENWLCYICSKLVTQMTCEKWFLAPYPRNSSFSYTSWFQQRKLLQESVNEEVNKVDQSDHEASEQSGADEDMVTFREEVVVIEQTDDEALEKKRMAHLTWLIDELRRDVSKEPMWAMISVSVLMLVLVLAGKACGMRAIRRDREIHVDIEEDFHNVSVMEVIRVKKRYLPKGFLRFKQRLRRKFRRKPRKIKEKDICEPLSDSSEGERLLYDRTNPV